ncbi:MAG: hypothetical protein IT426_13925 [Pirellulales bacterium]|nr:hypothetical protein [Pirellulales bacterium]
MRISSGIRLALLFSLLSALPLYSQQITVGTPFNSLNEGYYQRYGIAWGLNWPGGFARFGMPNHAVPPFGHFDPSGGLQSGWRFGNRNFNGNIFLSAAQGSYRSFTSQTPFVTVMNGYPGAFYDVTISPFVVGFTPVVGGYPMSGPMMPGVMPQNNSETPNPLDRVQVMRRLLAAQNEVRSAEIDEPDPGEAILPRHPALAAEANQASPSIQRSSAERPVPSVAEAKRLHEMEKKAADDEVLSLLKRAEAAEEEGKPQVAKIYYRMIVKRAPGELKQTAQRRLKELQSEKR